MIDYICEYKKYFLTEMDEPVILARIHDIITGIICADDSIVVASQGSCCRSIQYKVGCIISGHRKSSIGVGRSISP